jgi:uncharacterized BrkB/YihY/UPF0761 family membrane protein
VSASALFQRVRKALARPAIKLYIWPMQSVVLVLLGLAMAITLGVLFAGIITMAHGGETNRKWGNRLMRYRVVAQAVAIALFVLAMMIGKA